MTGARRAADQPWSPPRWNRARRSEAGVAYLFLTPFLLSFAAFFVAPSVYSAVLSLYEYSGFGEARFVGLRNYVALWDYPAFWQAVYNTAFYWVVTTVPMLIGAFLLAVAVRSRLTRWAWFHRSAIFLPQVMAPVAAALVWRIVFSTDAGVINSLTNADIGWLTDQRLMKISVCVLLIWRGIGFYFLMFLTGLARIDPELHEAARVDGASGWDQLRHVTVPLMRPVFLLAFVVNGVFALRLFAEPNLLITGNQSTQAVPGAVGPIMNVLVNNVTNGAFGLASAVGWILFVIIAVISAIQFRLFRDTEPSN